MLLTLSVLSPLTGWWCRQCRDWEVRPVFPVTRRRAADQALTWTLDTHQPVCASPPCPPHLLQSSDTRWVTWPWWWQDAHWWLIFRPNLAASDVNAVHSGFRGQDGCPGDGDSDHPGHHPDTGNSRWVDTWHVSRDSTRDTHVTLWQQNRAPA